MGEVVNLRRVRKAKARAASALEAGANRSKFGLSRVERETASSLRDLESARLDGHKRESVDEPADDHAK